MLQRVGSFVNRYGVPVKIGVASLLENAGFGPISLSRVQARIRSGHIVLVTRGDARLFPKEHVGEVEVFIRQLPAEDPRPLEYVPAGVSGLVMYRKEKNLPTVSRDFFDVDTLEYRIRTTLGISLPGTGLLQRLDTPACGWVLGATDSAVFDRFRDIRQQYGIRSFYRCRIQLSPPWQTAIETAREAKVPLLGALFPRGLPFDTSVISVESKFARCAGGDGHEMHLMATSGFVNVNNPDRKVTKVVSAARASGVVRSTHMIVRIGRRGEPSDVLDAEAVIVRGARHQVRAHYAFLGTPLVDDDLYNRLGVESRPRSVDGEGSTEVATTVVDRDARSSAAPQTPTRDEAVVGRRGKRSPVTSRAPDRAASEKEPYENFHLECVAHDIEGYGFVSADREFEPPMDPWR